MLAIIKTGGKQYKVKEGDKLKIEKLEGMEEGKTVKFDEVLLAGDEKDLKIGQPFLTKAKVEATVLQAEEKGKKVQMVKYKAKKRYSVKKGHRQPFTEVQITKITV